MFSASPSLAAKDTPRTGKKYQGVFAVSRRGGDEKTDGRTKNACFLHRMHQNERVAYTRSPSTVPRVHSVHQKPVFYTECLRKRVAYTRRPSPVPNATSAKRRKTLPAPNFSNCQKRKDHCKKRSPERRREQENHSQKVCNATQSYSVPQKVRHYTVI